MQLTLKTGDVLHEPSDLAILALFEGEAVPAAVAALIGPDDFRGGATETLLLYPQDAAAPRRLLLLGLGKAARATPETLRTAAALAVQRARALRAPSFTFGLAGQQPVSSVAAAQALAEGFALGGYRYDRFRTGMSDDQKFGVAAATLLVGSGEEAMAPGLASGQAVARGVAFARDLVNTPGGVLTPAAFADEAVALGARAGLKVTVLDKPKLVEGGFGGILAVGQGSANEPRLIVMEHGQPDAGVPTICLVGKGLTFDSGGLSIKPADAMTTMKGDMGGGAAVFGAMQAVAELKLPLHVVGIVPAAENMPSGTAFRPDDVITTLSGKTVEVLNTDAEGRIILADGLHYALQYKPQAIVEVSTLTGAIIIALGSQAIGLMATDQALADRLLAAGTASGERAWQLPLWEEYYELIKSEIADMKNLGGRPAGSITAGCFLANFAGETPFAHLDIAGTAYAERPAKPYNAPGGTGVGVRLLTEFLRGYAA